MGDLALNLPEIRIWVKKSTRIDEISFSDTYGKSIIEGWVETIIDIYFLINLVEQTANVLKIPDLNF